MSVRIIDSINEENMPAILNLYNADYEALIGTTDYTEEPVIEESADFNCGAIVNELEMLRAYIAQVVGYDDPVGAEDDWLDKIVEFFLTIERFLQETDAALLNRFNSLILRKETTPWQTTWCIEDVFSYFFNYDDIYVIENFIEDGDNLLLNSDLEDVTGSDFDNWTKTETGASLINVDVTINMFSGDVCAEFEVDVSGNAIDLKQTISSVAAGEYKLSLFYKDDGTPTTNAFEVEITRSSDGYYYNDTDSSWQSGPHSISLPIISGTLYEYWSLYIDNEGTEDIEIKIQNASGETSYKAYVDLIKFGEWKTYPSVKALVGVSGSDADNLLMWVGTTDNYIDRSNCESGGGASPEDGNSPMIFDETNPDDSNCTWQRSNDFAYEGTHSYKFTKTVAVGTTAYLGLTDQLLSTDMHGLVAGVKYPVGAYIYIPTASGILGSEIRLMFYDYQGGGWDVTSQAAANIYDEWQKVTVTRTLRSSATGTVLRLFVSTGAANNEYFYVDNVSCRDGDMGNLDHATFLDIDFMDGPGSGYITAYFDSVLERIKEAGTKAQFEYMERAVV